MTKFNDLFPTYSSGVIFSAYMIFCVGQGILVTASRTGKSEYDYNTVAAVLFTEILKLVIATACYLKDHNFSTLVQTVRSNARLGALYLVPSFLYCIYNNLAFVNLASFDPTTYYLLLQLRVVVTGILFQLIFSKKLSGCQWFSLLLLTAGCMLQQLNWDYFSSANALPSIEPNSSIVLSFNIMLIILQTACSSLAGVYNEYLLKNEGGNVDVFIQNIFMYLDSILWNVAALLHQGTLLDSLTLTSISSIATPLVMLLMLNNALIGITTSLFLKNLNSILKTFASALELTFTAVLCFAIFGVAIKPNTYAAIAVVSYSIYLYSKYPVVNPATTYEKKPMSAV